MSTDSAESSAAQTPAACAEGGDAKPEKHTCSRGGCPFIGSIVGSATVILAIIGLAGRENTYVPYLLAVLTIIVGLGLLGDGCALMGRCAKLLCEAEKSCQTSHHHCCHSAQMMSGLSTELFAGAVGVLLGVLALLGVAAAMLVPAAIIVFGTSLACTSCLRARLCHIQCAASEKSEAFRQIAHEAAMAAAGARALIGLAAVILGILAVLGNNPIVLSLVALLVLGVPILLGGIAASGKMCSAVCHH